MTATAKIAAAAATPREHYERLLAQHYTWMFGASFAEKVGDEKALLREAGVVTPGVAIDLGCGSGFQSVALAELGASRVHAVDSSAALLQELGLHTGGLPVTAHEGDLLAFDQLAFESVDTVVCMGDTLTHLGAPDDVRALLAKIAVALSPGGRVILSWRDLSAPPEGLNRFIPVRSDDERIMTCFLEDLGDAVLVHDLVYEKEDGAWQLRKSAYPKLKLSEEFVISTAESAGLRVVHRQVVRGMLVVAATRSLSGANLNHCR